MDLNNRLNQYLGKQARISSKPIGDGTTEVCDLDTGDCYVVREKDGLIERVENTMTINKKVKVETRQGFKQLLNG